ncbi:hypothetical protein RHS03_04739, partial [Rhizoctonia solani]
MSYSLSVTNLKPIFPTISLDQPGKRCMDATWQSIVPSVAPEPNTTVHNTRLNNRYFKSGNFLTYNNIYHPDVLSVFLRAKNVIQDRIQDLLDTRSDSIEIAIAIRCISSSSPKVSYYIVDHAHKTVRWLDNSTPKCYHVNVDIQMRDSAEYWHHRSKFSVHRHCLQEDRAEVAALLNAMLGASQNDPDLDQEEIEQYIRRLENIPLLSPFTDDQTSTLAIIHSEALQHSLPAFYLPSPSIKNKLCQSLFGRSVTRFIHNHAHVNPHTSMPRVVQSHSHRWSQPNANASHSNRHTGTTPPRVHLH